MDRAFNFRLCNDKEDLAQECNAYMKVKFFMSKRIFELEKTVDQLKNELTLQVTKNAQMMEWLKSLSASLEAKKSERIFNHDNFLSPNQKFVEEVSKGEVNLSGDMADSIIIVEKDQEKKVDSVPQSPFNENLEFLKIQTHNDKIIEEKLKTENLELLKENQQLRNQITSNDLKISKLETDKLILINELQEILNSLNRVDLKTLQKFYLENSTHKRVDIPSSLGIKYNILSTYSSLSQMFKASNQENLKIFNLENIFKSYEDEFEKLINKNLTKDKLLKE
jgi:hypothetical protein